MEVILFECSGWDVFRVLLLIFFLLLLPLIRKVSIKYSSLLPPPKLEKKKFTLGKVLQRPSVHIKKLHKIFSYKD